MQRLDHHRYWIHYQWFAEQIDHVEQRRPPKRNSDEFPSTIIQAVTGKNNGVRAELEAAMQIKKNRTRENHEFREVVDCEERRIANQLREEKAVANRERIVWQHAP